MIGYLHLRFTGTLKKKFLCVQLSETKVNRPSIIYIRDLNVLPDSLISPVAEGAEDGVSKFTSLVRANDLSLWPWS